MHDPLVELYVRMFPYVAAARLRRARTLPQEPFAARPATSPGAPLNRIGRQRRHSDPSYRAGVGISTDTLYTSAWLDLAGEPLVLETPRFDGRYYSFQPALADTYSEVALGLRSHGVDLPPVFLHGPDHDGDVPEDMVVICSRTRYLNLPGRILVDPDDPDDMAAAHSLQDEVRLRTWSAFREGVDSLAPVPPQVPCPAPADDPRTFLSEVSAVLLEEGLSAEDQRWVDQAGLDVEALRRAELADAEAAFAEGRALVDEKAMDLGVRAGGWTTNLRGPRFGDDHLLRAGVARDQIYVTVPEEGVYPVARTDAEGEPLRVGSNYRIVLAADAVPPVDAFWSITLYDADGFLVDNDAGVHAVSSRALRHRANGAVAIAVGAHPADEHAMWLPAPAGEFYLMMRLFLPGPSVRSGEWRPPPVERVA